MLRIAHLSDVHFGRVRQVVLDPLRRRLEELRPDLLVISGDLTQRARTHEFEAARAYIDTLPGPHLVIPGNHDVPLWNAAIRLATPLRQWRRAWGEDAEPVVRSKDLVAAGLCSAHGWTFKHGRLTSGQRRRLGEVMHAAPPTSWKVLAVHHPLVLGEDIERVARGADKLLGSLADASVDLILCGHEHRSWSAIAFEHSPSAGPGILVVHAGTATSDRLRSEGNCFNVVDLGDDDVKVTVESFDDGNSSYSPIRHQRFVQRGKWAVGPQDAA